MALLPKVKLKALVSFPANVHGGTGIEVGKTSGNFTIDLDYTEFAIVGGMPANTYVLVWDPIANSFVLVPPASTSGIGDAPNDGKTYGRKVTAGSGAWIDAWSSPVLIGNPTAPTPAFGDSDTSIATTAFVAAAVTASVSGVSSIGGQGGAITINGGLMPSTILPTPRYDVPQTLTAVQQTQARVNIAAAPADAQAYSGMQINGSMEIDQVNGYAVYTFPAGSASGVAIIDGWRGYKTGTNAFTVQSVASVFPGYGRELKLTVTTAQAAIGSDYIQLRHYIEGYRFLRAAWGTASAQPVTFGFWVTSSVAGSYLLSLLNYPSGAVGAQVSINVTAANTPQWVTATFAAQTTGVWDTTNGVGAQFVVTVAQTGQANIAATNGNTFEITGLVILPGIEAPSAARAPLIMRPYDQELLTCQRYWWASNPTNPKGVTVGTLTGFSLIVNSIGLGNWRYTVPLRVSPVPPALTVWNNGVQNQVRNSSTGAAIAIGGIGTSYLGTQGGALLGVTTLAASVWVDFDLIADARL